MPRRRLRLLLAALAAATLSIGVPATVTPHAFYLGYPYVSHWVDLLPPFNEHLATDVGELYLAFGALFAWAALRPSAALVVPAGATFGAAEALHAVFHATHSGHTAAGEALAELASLTALAGLAFACAVLARRFGQAPR